MVLDGTAEQLQANEDVKEFYLGGGGEQRKSFKEPSRASSAAKRWL